MAGGWWPVAGGSASLTLHRQRLLAQEANTGQSRLKRWRRLRDLEPAGPFWLCGQHISFCSSHSKLGLLSVATEGVVMSTDIGRYDRASLGMLLLFLSGMPCIFSAC